MNTHVESGRSDSADQPQFTESELDQRSHDYAKEVTSGLREMGQLAPKVENDDGFREALSNSYYRYTTTHFVVVPDDH